MNFRIRRLDSDEFAQYEDAYYQHLKQFQKTSDTGLWKFFGWDFFHDGAVKAIQGANLARRQVTPTVYYWGGLLAAKMKVAVGRQQPFRIEPLR